MEQSSTIKKDFRKTAARLALGILMVVSVTGAAHADWDHDRGWRGHEVRAHRYWHGPRPYAREVYAPPVVYAPPSQPSGLNLILPIHIN